MIEGNDVYETFAHFDKHDLKGMNGKRLENYLTTNHVTFYQVFNLIARMTLKMIQQIDSSSEIKNTIDRINDLKAKSKQEREAVEEESEEDDNNNEYLDQITNLKKQIKELKNVKVTHEEKIDELDNSGKLLGEM